MLPGRLVKERPVAFSADEKQPFLGYEIAQGRDYSEATAARVDECLIRILVPGTRGSA